MSKMVQVRNVPDSLHRKLKAHAVSEGLSLSDYLKRELDLIAQRPTLAELQRRLARRAPVLASESPAQAVRAERDSS